MKRQLPLSLLLLAVWTAPASAATRLVEKWSVTPASLPPPDYTPATGSTERSIGYNKLTNRLVLATRAGGSRAIVLDAATGAYLHTLDMTGVSGGNGNAFNQIDVADDGKVYACNLVVHTNPSLRIYRWPSDDATVPDPNDPGTMIPNSPTLIHAGDPSAGSLPTRWGDTFDVRGSGVNTQILLGSSAGTGTNSGAACVFVTDEFESWIPTVYPGALETGDSRGVCFGAGNTFYSKVDGTTKNIRRASFDVAAGTSAVLNDFSGGGRIFSALAADVPGNLLAMVEYPASGRRKVNIADISAPGVAPVIIASKELQPDPFNVNASRLSGATFVDGKLFVVDANNGITAFAVEVDAAVDPPVVTSPPANRTVYLRGQTTFSVTASGTAPLAYQWFLGDTLLPGATGPSLTVNPVTAADAGAYKCRVTNASPTVAESAPATLTTRASTDSAALTPGWRVAPGARPWLTTDTTERGMDYSPAKNRLYVVSRATNPPAIRILNADDGADAGQLNMTDVLVTGQTFSLNSIAVDDGGAIYAASLTTSGSGFRIYRWANDEPDTPAEKVYEGTAVEGRRIGDFMDAQGSGDNVRLAVTTAAKSFVIFQWNPGSLQFDAYPIEISDAAAEAFRLCIRFGEGDTVWGKGDGVVMTRASFDITNLQGGVLATVPVGSVPGPAVPFGIEKTTGAMAMLETADSDNVRLYDFPQPWTGTGVTPVTLLDQEFLATDNPNANRVGAVAVHGNRAWVLSTTNGISSYSIVKPAAAAPPEITDVTLSGGGNVVFTLKGTPGKTYLIEKSTALSPAAAWTADGTVTPAAATETVTRAVDPGQPRLFWRAREQ